MAAVILVVAGILLLILLLRLLTKPIKWALKLLFSAILGFVGLALLNIVGSPIGIYLNINWFNVLVAGILGIPGVLLLLLFKYIL